MVRWVEIRKAFSFLALCTAHFSPLNMVRITDESVLETKYSVQRKASLFPAVGD